MSRRTPGLGRTYRPEYKAWRDAIHRCYNPNALKYPRYGGRGITVCDEWRENFMAFLMAVGRRPGPDYSIDRIDNDGNYEPGNVKWSTRAEQQSNMVKNTLLTLDGRTQTLSKWSRELGIPKSTISTRLANGWSDEDALTVLTSGVPERADCVGTYKGRALTLEAVAEMVGLAVETIQTRMKVGWSLIDAVCVPRGVTRAEHNAA